MTGSILSMRVAVKTVYTSMRIILVYECNANVVYFDGVQLFTASGQRISKTVGGTTYNYHYLGDQLVEMAWGANRMHFTYDAVGPLSVNFNGTEYFYLKTAQGDVTGLADSTGAKVVAYTYGPWGESWGVIGTLASTLGAANPLRYRGYVYDTETGLYYLNSRYYNPTWGRFINADSEVAGIGGDVRGSNLFEYCFNNPVNMSDPGGNWPKWVSGLLDIASGVTQILAGVAMATAAAATGIGVAVGVGMILNGAATIISGGSQIYNYAKGTNSVHEENWIRTGVKALGKVIGGEKGQKTAEIMYDAADLVSTVYSIGGGIKAINHTAAKLETISSISKSSFSMLRKSKFYNVYSAQSAMSPIKSYISLPKPWFRITNMVGAGIDVTRTTANNIIPLFN